MRQRRPALHYKWELALSLFIGENKNVHITHLGNKAEHAAVLLPKFTLFIGAGTLLSKFCFESVLRDLRKVTEAGMQSGCAATSRLQEKHTGTKCSGANQSLTQQDRPFMNVRTCMRR
jgi:hypothetical protein